MSKESIGGTCVDFNVLSNLGELVCKLKMHADIAVFINLDVLYQIRRDFSGRLFPLSNTLWKVWSSRHFVQTYYSMIIVYPHEIYCR